jgi:hypothetical protein
MHLEPHRMTRAQKLQFLSEVQAGKIDVTSLEQMAVYFCLPSNETPGNWLVITAEDTIEMSPKQYKAFCKKGGWDE